MTNVKENQWMRELQDFISFWFWLLKKEAGCIPFVRPSEHPVLGVASAMLLLLPLLWFSSAVNFALSNAGEWRDGIFLVGIMGGCWKKHFPISFVYPIRNHWRFAALLSSTSTFPIVLSCTLWNNFKSLALKTLLLITSKLQRSPLTKDYFQKANGFFFKVDNDWTCLSWNHSFLNCIILTPDIPIGHISTLVDSSVLRSALPCARPSASAYRKETGFGTSYSPIEELRKSIFRMTNRRFNKG